MQEQYNQCIVNLVYKTKDVYRHWKMSAVYKAL